MQRSLPEALACLSVPDWEELVRESIIHGASGLLCQHLLRSGAEFLQEDLAAACRTHIDECESSFAAGLCELRHVLDALAAAGIEAVPFKGPGLALRTYPNPTLRKFRDLDVLVRPSQREAALAVLVAAGYRCREEDLPPSSLRAYHRYNGQEFLSAPDRFAVEPHWALAPRPMSADIDVEGLLARAVTFEAPGGIRLRGFAPEDVLLAAALHGAKEEWTRLIWVTDIAAICAAWPALDAAALLERATRCGCRRMVLVAILLAQELVGAAPPALLLERAHADPEVPRLVALIRRRLPLPDRQAPSIFTVTAFRWRVRERLTDRVRYGLRTMLTAHTWHYKQVPLPDGLAFLYPVVRLGLDWIALPVWRMWGRSEAWRRRRA